MKKRMRYIVLGAVCMGMVVTAVSCSGNNDEQSSTSTPGMTNQTEGTQTAENLEFDTVVLKVGEEEVTYRELLVYLLQIKNKYEPSLGTDIWSYQVETDKTFEDMAKEELLSELTEIKIITQQATELDIQLEADELEEVKANVKSYLDKVTLEDQEKYGLTEEVVTKVLSDNYLAEKVFAITTNEVNTNISDEDAKQIKVEQIMVMTEGVDKNGNVIDMDDTQKANAEVRANQLHEAALTAEDFNAFASSNTDAAYVDFTFGKGQMPELESVAFALQEGEISSVIPTSTGYVILKLVSGYDEDATRLRKEQIIEEEQNEVFASKYEVWSAEYKVTQDVAKWEKISFGF